jgi:hypothetical protein
MSAPDRKLHHAFNNPQRLACKYIKTDVLVPCLCACGAIALKLIFSTEWERAAYCFTKDTDLSFDRLYITVV